MNLLPDHNLWPFDIALKCYNDKFYSKLEHDSFYQTGDHFQLVKNVTTDYTADNVTYDLNYGFRARADYQYIDIMTLGCSHTFGVGIPLEHTWGYQLTKKLNMNTDRYANLGMCGASMENVLMIASSVIMRHQPKVVAILAPHSERSIIMNNNDRIVTLFPGNAKNPEILEALGDNAVDKLDHWHEWLDDNHRYQEAKITMMKYCIQRICSASHSRLLWVDLDNDLRNKTVYDTEHLNRARDRMHVDGYHNNIFAEKFMEIYK